MTDLMARPVRDLIADGYDVHAHCGGCGYVVLLHPNFLPDGVTPVDIQARGRCKRCGAKGPRVEVERPAHAQITYGGHG